MLQVFYITNFKQLRAVQRVFKDLAKYDGKTFRLTKHEEIKDKSPKKPQRRGGATQSLFIPKGQFLNGLAPVMGRKFGSVPPAFTEKLFGGKFAPARGDAAYRVYQRAQQQRLEVFLKNIDLFIDPRKTVITNRGQYIASYSDQVGLFQNDGQLGSSLNEFLTEA
jgi:hypothetical protein